jgi:hypothetical protein
MIAPLPPVSEQDLEQARFVMDVSGWGGWIRPAEIETIAERLAQALAAARAEGAAAERAKGCETCNHAMVAMNGTGVLYCRRFEIDPEKVLELVKCSVLGNRCGRWRQRGEEA